MQNQGSYPDEDELEAERIVQKLLQSGETVVVIGWPLAEKVSEKLLAIDKEKKYAVDRRGRAYLFGLKESLYPEQPQKPPRLSIEDLYAPAIKEFIRVRRYQLSDEYDSLAFLIAAYAELEGRGMNPEAIRYEKKEGYTLFYLIGE